MISMDDFKKIYEKKIGNSVDNWPFKIWSSSHQKLLKREVGRYCLLYFECLCFLS